MSSDLKPETVYDYTDFFLSLSQYDLRAKGAMWERRAQVSFKLQIYVSIPPPVKVLNDRKHEAQTWSPSSDF